MSDINGLTFIVFFKHSTYVCTSFKLEGVNKMFLGWSTRKFQSYVITLNNIISVTKQSWIQIKLIDGFI